MDKLQLRPELLPLLVNSIMAVVYLYPDPTIQWGKVLYWLGATILTIGVLLMRG